VKTGADGEDGKTGRREDGKTGRREDGKTGGSGRGLGPIGIFKTFKTGGLGSEGQPMPAAPCAPARHGARRAVLSGCKRIHPGATTRGMLISLI